ncbi:restriction endonuclease subunit S [Corynebacterium camporealensis]|uniref:restriction endonuclease subunit S n=1 Tax=Corynebacterium camporealensis TaxID=161896 RepID=UPI0034CFBE9A
MTTLTQLIEHYCPDGVEYVKLGDVATYYRGLTYSKKNEVESGGLKVLRANNVSLDTQRIDWNDVKAVELDKPVKRTCLLKQDDILMVANSGSKAHVGKIAYINQDFVDVAFGGFMATIRTKDPRSSRYVYHALSSDEFKAYKDRVLSSATINNLKKSIVEEFQIPLPPREVQDAIVERLDAFAALIESLDSEIALREKRFEYFREQLLTFDESDGVEDVELGDVAEYSSLRVDSDDLNADTFVGVDNLLKDRGGKTLSEHGSNTKRSTKYQLGDVLIGNIRPYLRKIWHATNEGGCSGDVLAIHPSKVDSRFLYWTLFGDEFWHYNNSFSRGGKMPRGDKAAILAYQFPLPTVEVQREIVAKLDTMQALIDNLRQERELRKTQFEFYREKLLTFNS